MANFGSILKQLRRRDNITQEELANKLEISRSAVGMYETGGREPDFETLEAIADLFNVDMNYLIGKTGSENRDYYSAQNISVVRIPVVGEVVAGIPTEAVEDVVDWEEISTTMAQRGDYIGLKVKGSSMEPRFLDGDTVIVRRQPDVESGEIAIVFVNGDAATMKKVLKQEDGITLVALNTSVYEPHFYSNKQIDTLPVTIYGKVVELRGKF